MTLTKLQIIESIQEQLKLLRTESYELVENLLEIIKRIFESGDNIMISGFGKFCVKEKKGQKRT
ncbi:MAG: HU family DNA-binding protein [Deltaproteobacteria bacterium]|nr:HU family DNA-binding protein [Deltaproteobacteria bacterium]MBW2218311.1 HU family DNA-binding protein [Deltaproteobacteria bacterium]